MDEIMADQVSGIMATFPDVVLPAERELDQCVASSRVIS
jgi:hypothetical protein